MPKFNDPTRLFNNATYKYGVDGANPAGALQWIFLVDWDGTETFNYNESHYMIDLQVKRGERYFVKPNGNGFETMRPGEGTGVLTNNTGRFDPDNAGGALYNKILPGRKFMLKVKDLGTGTVYPVMAGYINDIPPITEYNRIQLSLRESTSLLDRNVSIPILYRNSISDAMNALLDASKFPARFGRLIDAETQQVTAFAVDNINALDVLLDLGAASLGQVFADNTGRVKFYGRGQSSMPSVSIDQAQVLKMIRRSQPWENLRNIIQVVANKKVKKREEPVWQTGTPIQVSAGASTTFSATYSPAIDVKIYSLKANSAINGSGADYSASVTASLNIYSNSIEISLSNAAGIDVFVSLVLTGRPIVDQPMRVKVQNALSTTTYGEMTFVLDNPYCQDYNHAQAYSTMISNFLDEPQRTIEVQIEQIPSLQFSFDVMDKIAFTSAKLGISGTYYAGLIEHRWNTENGQSVTTTLVMRPRLTDATTIGNDVEDPDLPFIPEPELPPGGWPLTPPGGDPTPPGGTCLTDPGALPNGPFPLMVAPFFLLSNSNTSSAISINQKIYMRPGTFDNPTTIGVTGDWQKWNKTTAKWEGETTDANWRVGINNQFGEIQPHVDAGSGTRTIKFKTAGASEINLVNFEIDPTGAGDYTLGSAVQSSSVSSGVTTPYGNAVTLTAGNYYAIEGAGGPWYSGASAEWWISIVCMTTFQVVTVGFSTYYGSYIHAGDLYYEIVGTPGTNARAYFQALGSSYQVIVGDDPASLGDNTGNKSYVVSNVTYNQPHRFYVRNLALYNVCSL